MSRTHIHFAPGLPKESEIVSGMRTSSQIYIYVDLAKALAGRGIWCCTLAVSLALTILKMMNVMVRARDDEM